MTGLGGSAFEAKSAGEAGVGGFDEEEEESEGEGDDDEKDHEAPMAAGGRFAAKETGSVGHVGWRDVGGCWRG